MTPDTIVRMYSMTKAIVSVAAMILVEEGKLALDTPISKYVPKVNAMKVGTIPAEKEMTLRDILRHTAGFPNNVTVDRLYRQAGLPSLANSTLREMTERLNHIPLRSEPGTEWHYSFGTDALAHLVEVGSGQSIDAFLEKRIFKPLKMTDTAFYCPTSKWERFALLYGRNLEPVAASQPGTSGPFTFEIAPKFLSGGGRSGLHRNRLHPLLSHAVGNGPTGGSAAPEGENHSGNDTQSITRCRISNLKTSEGPRVRPRICRKG